MEQLKNRMDTLKTALDRLEESLDSFASSKKTVDDRKHRESRDCLIKRLEFCFDLLWKCLKDHLEQKHGIVIASPKSSFRECLAQNVINEEEFKALASMLDDRNNTSHRYDEFMAEDIANRVSSYYDCMIAICNRLKP